jgi:hypothetical protein
MIFTTTGEILPVELIACGEVTRPLFSTEEGGYVGLKLLRQLRKAKGAKAAQYRECLSSMFMIPLSLHTPLSG